MPVKTPRRFPHIPRLEFRTCWIPFNTEHPLEPCLGRIWHTSPGSALTQHAPSPHHSCENVKHQLQLLPLSVTALTVLVFLLSVLIYNHQRALMVPLLPSSAPFPNPRPDNVQEVESAKEIATLKLSEAIADGIMTPHNRRNLSHRESKPVRSKCFFPPNLHSQN